QQLAGAALVSDHVGRGLAQWGDARAEQEHLAIADDGVAFADVGAAGADRLELPALQRQPCLQAVLQVVLMPRALVEGDGAAGGLSLTPAALVYLVLRHPPIVSAPSRWAYLKVRPPNPCLPSAVPPWSNTPPSACSRWSTTFPPTRSASAGATPPRCWSRRPGAWLPGWTSRWAHCGPGSPPRMSLSPRSGSTCGWWTDRSAGCRGSGSSMHWMNQRAGGAPPSASRPPCACSVPRLPWGSSAWPTGWWMNSARPGSGLGTAGPAGTSLTTPER